MRMLFTCISGLGSLHPQLALAREAHSAGHEVAVATGEERRSIVERLGMQFMPIGGDFRGVMRERHPDLQMPPIDAESTRQVRRLVFAGILIELTLPALLDGLHSWKPDILVRGHLALAAWLAAEELGIPHVEIEEYSSGELAATRELLRDPLTNWISDRGLPPDPELTTLYRYLVLAPFPASLRHPDAPFGPTARRTQPLIFNETDPGPSPAWLDDLPPGPIVHASLGTASQRPELLRILVDGLADQPYTAVIATGTPQLLEGLGPLPANVRAAPFIPHTNLLPKCDALITHAGAGTLITGIMHGLPMAMIPLFGDQPPNAEMAAAAGAGIVLDQHTLTPGAVREATTKLLGDPSYRENSQRIRDEALSLPDHREAVGWLEQIARDRSPVR